MTRKATIDRNTKETEIKLSLNIDGSGRYKIITPVPFFTHMLELLTKHGLFDITLTAKGDVDIDPHHTVEDVGITLGEAFKKALGKKMGVRRFGKASIPLDESLSEVTVDLSGRPYLVYKSDFKKGKIGAFDVDLVDDFLQAFSNSLGANLHVQVLYGRNKHHIIESLFKSLARALDEATQVDPRVKGVPSTKGKL